MNKSRLASLTLHASIVALVMLCGSAIQPVVEHQRYRETLVLPAYLPVPIVRPAHTMSEHQPAASRTVARLVVGMARVSAASHEAAPQPLKLDTSTPVELPQTAQLTVTAAPVARQAGFGRQMGVIGSGNGRGVNQAGFGAATGTGHSGEGRVVTAGFNVSPAAPPVVTRIDRPSVQPAIVTYTPHPQYTAEARAAGTSGQVLLRVCLKADGKLEVMGVVQGLGHGLNEEAERVAAGVQFVPERRDGAPVDSIHTLTVDFELGQ